MECHRRDRLMGDENVLIVYFIGLYGPLFSWSTIVEIGLL